MEIKNALQFRKEIIALLEQAKLPTEDLPAELFNFLTILYQGRAIAAAGIEQFGQYGLLRSVVVSQDFRDQGIAGQLLEAIERLTAGKGIKTVYLLTETAPGYFSRKGYQQIERDAIPAEVQLSSEVSHVCPQSAIVMRKVIADYQ